MALNLLPIPPLDGGRIAVSLLPDACGARVRAHRAFRTFHRRRLAARSGVLDNAHGAAAAARRVVAAGVARAVSTPAQQHDHRSMFADRVLSGMRPTGACTSAIYHGALKNWIRLQEEYECLFFAADWHALTTHFDEPETIARQRLGHVRRLARGRHRSDARDAVHPVARAGARRAHAAARHDRRPSAGSSACRRTRTSSRSSPTATCRISASSAIR